MDRGGGKRAVVQCFLKSRYLAVEQCFITKEGCGGFGQAPRMVECAFANGAPPSDGGHGGDMRPPCIFTERWGGRLSIDPDKTTS